MQENRKCLECDTPITGRSDKKFCGYLCRNSFGNRTSKEKEKHVIAINKQLRVNWKILKTLNPQGKTTVRKEYMEQQGYDFRYFTNVYRTKAGRIYYFCYDMGIAETDKTHVSVVNWQEYMSDYIPPIAKID